MAAQFKKLYGRRPRTVLDVGTGSGHFVYACRQLGMKADGIELSGPSIDFCRKNFKIELKPVDFTRQWRNFLDADIVTFWGGIEHVPDPTIFLKTAHKVLGKKEGFVIAEVPRWDSISTAMQSLFPESVVRHLDPLGHAHIFTDTSLVTVFKRSGIAPVAAWYFGMDAYEKIIQMSHLLRNENLIKRLNKKINFLQDTFDKNHLSDMLVLAGRPLRYE